MPDILDYLPPWALTVAVAVVVVGSAIQLWETGKLVAVKLAGLWRYAVRPSARHDVARRRRIAVALLRNLDLLEDELRWRKEMFTDFTVTIEAVDTPRRRRWALPGRVAPTYRARSLSSAMAHQPGQFVLLQAAPGAGKSVAMRHYARGLLERARRARSAAPLALAVSLRDFRATGPEVTVEQLHGYVCAQVNPTGSVELAEYLRDDLAADIRAGRVALLFDSFDEIPAILASSNIDAAVRPYLSVITNYVGGGRARCIIAAREYKGPRLEWFTRLEIAGLQFGEQTALLRAAGVPAHRLEGIGPLLRDPRAGFAVDLRNPLHLSLLAGYLRAHEHPPDRPSELFADYARTRLSEVDTEVTAGDVTRLEWVLAAFAFGLMRRRGASLSAGEGVLRRVVGQYATGAQADRLVGIALDSKLLVVSGRDRQVAFVHRRVQEYFATRYVLAHPRMLHPDELAGDGRWRETAVALLQLGVRSGPLHTAIQRILARQLLSVRTAAGFAWPAQAVHVLELLVSAYGARPAAMAQPIRELVSELVAHGWTRGGIGDRKFALDCLPVTVPAWQSRLVREAFSGRSQWLRRSALRDCAALAPLPAELDEAIRKLLITLIGGRELARDAAAIDSDLGRLYDKQDLLRARPYLAATPRVVSLCWALMAAGGAAMLAAELLSARRDGLAFVITLLALAMPLQMTAVVAVFWETQSWLSYPSGSRVRRLFEPVSDYLTGGDPLRARRLLRPALVFAVMWGGFWLGTAVQVARDGHVIIGVLNAALVPAAIVAAGWWAPTLLHAFAGRRLGRAETWRLLLPTAGPMPKPPRKPRRRIVLTGLGAKLRTFARELGKAVLGMIVLLAVWAGVWLLSGPDGLFVAIMATFGAYFGHVVLVRPLWRLIGEWRLWRRTRRSMSRGARVTPEALLDTMVTLADPVGVAQYLAHLRIRRSGETSGLPRQFVRDLADVVDAAGRGGAVGREVDARVGEAVASGRLTPQLMLGWGAEVLDELGRIDQSLRER